MTDNCGMFRSKEMLTNLLEEIPDLREAFWHDLKLVGDAYDLNEELEKAWRVSDFLEMAELMAQDALHRNESCGGHFREEHQTEENEAKRDDKHYSYVAAWEYQGSNKPEVLHKEQLQFEFVKQTQRSYK